MQDWQTIPNVRDNTPWYRDSGRMKLNFFLSIIFVGLVLNGYDGTVISGLLAFDSWRSDLGLEDGREGTAALIGLLNAAGPLAGFVIGPVIAWIDDNLGRKWGIRFYGYNILTGTVLSCIAGASGVRGRAGLALFMVGRFVIGFGLASFLMTSLVMVQEIPHPRSRSTVSASWNSYYILGMVIASWVNFGCSYMSGSWQWRVPYILQVPMALYILIAIQFAPETPRFLLGKGRDGEAFDFLVKYHGNGDREDPLVLFEFEEIKVTLDNERLAKAEKWSNILRGRANRRRLGLSALMTFLTNMSGSSIIYFYYTIIFGQVGITDPTTQTGIAAGLNMFCWVCQLSCAFWALKHVGRKTIILSVWPFLLLCLVGLCATGGVYAKSDSTNTGAGIANIVMVWLYLGAFNFTNPILYSYPAEVQTYSMRTKGLLLWNTITQFEYIYVVFVDSIALDAIGYKYYAVYMPLVIIQWFLAKYFMVETRGYTLEEVDMAFEGIDSVSDLSIAGNPQAFGTNDVDKKREGSV